MKFTSTIAVSEPSGCWRVAKREQLRSGQLRAPGSKGYVTIRINGSAVKAHRYMYEAALGPVLDGLQLDHLCRNPSCVNPAHLEPVSSRENSRRSPFFNGHKTRCANGHLYAGNNLRTYKKADGGPQRRCVICYRNTIKMAMRRRREKLRGKV